MFFRRSLTYLFTALVLVVGGHLVGAVCLNLSEEKDALSAMRHWYKEWLREGEIESYEENWEARRTAKREVADAVAERRLSLAEGIDQFRALFPEGLDSLMPGESETEKLGRCLIRFAAYDIQRSPKRLREMEHELQCYLAAQHDPSSSSSPGPLQ